MHWPSDGLVLCKGRGMAERCTSVDLLACSRSLANIPDILTVISVWFYGVSP